MRWQQNLSLHRHPHQEVMCRVQKTCNELWKRYHRFQFTQAPKTRRIAHLQPSGVCSYATGGEQHCAADNFQKP